MNLTFDIVGYSYKKGLLLNRVRFLEGQRVPLSQKSRPSSDIEVILLVLSVPLLLLLVIPKMLRRQESDFHLVSERLS